MAHDERPLFKTRHVPEQVYRILLIPSLQDSCTVRIEREESGWSLTGTIVGVATRGGHQAPGTIKATATRRLNEQESAQFTREIAAINLWSLRTWAECSRPQEGDTFYACVDGTSLILEGRRRGTEEPSYRAVDRDGGEGDGTMELASRFLSLSGFTWQCEQQ